MSRSSPAAALLVAASASLLAQASGAEEATELDPVVVTATRTARTVNASLASVTVIERSDIERLQAVSVPDLLRGVQGLQVSNSGGPGKVTDIYTRGTSADHTLVLIDGVKVGSATTGTTAWQDLPIDQIERIEVVRGPRSSLYGSEAIGGVIQIFTRKGGGALKPSLSLGGGSYRSANASANLSGGGDSGWWSLGGSYQDTEGFNACTGVPGTAGCFTDEPDIDGYRNVAGSARGGYRFGRRGDLDLFWLGTKAQSRFDGSFVNDTKTNQQVFGAKGRFSPLDPWDLTLALGQSRDDSDNRLDGSFVTAFDTLRETASLQSDLTLGVGQILTLGVDWQNDHITSTEDYAEDSRDNVGVFGQIQASLQGHDLSASLRQDDNQQFGTHATGSAAWGYSLSNGVRLLASYGTAFKAPTFNELYFPLYGNPDLAPEQSRSAELGVSGDLGLLQMVRQRLPDQCGRSHRLRPVLHPGEHRPGPDPRPGAGGHRRPPRLDPERQPDPARPHQRVARPGRRQPAAAPGGAVRPHRPGQGPGRLASGRVPDRGGAALRRHRQYPGPGPLWDPGPARRVRLRQGFPGPGAPGEPLRRRL